jgi:DNA-binding NarL/FixJ family response regulator
MASKKLRVVLTESQTILRDGLKALINTQPDMRVVGEAECGPAALKLARRLCANVIVMEAAPQGVHSTQLVEAAKRRRCPLRLLVLTANEMEVYLRRQLKAGVSGFVLKRSPARTFLQAIRAIAGGGVFLDPCMMHKLARGATRGTRAGRPRADELSEREIEVLRLMAWGYANKEVAHNLGISVKTVETYKNRLMQKLGLRCRVDIVRYALRRGWLKAEGH